MSKPQDPIELYSELAKVGMPPHKFEEIWDEIEQSPKTPRTQTQRKRLLRRMGPFAAAVAGIAIIVGVYAVGHPFTSKVSEATPISIPSSEITSGDWTLAIYKSLLTTGARYQIVPFYVGRKPISTSNLTITWGAMSLGGSGGKFQSGPNDRLQSGTAVSELGLIQFRRPLDKQPPFVISWRENNKKHTVKFIFSRIQPLQTTNVHKYTGHDKLWSVQYTYEVIKGKGFSQPYGVMVVHYKGKQLGTHVAYTLNSPAGKRKRQETIQGGHFKGNSVRFEINPTLKGNNITASTAHITIQSQGVSSRITLTKQ